MLSWNPFVKFYRSSNIDGFLTHPEWFEKEQKFELYCHPDYMDGMKEVLMDNSISYFGNEKQPLETNIQLLTEMGDWDFVSWAEE